MKKWTLVRIMGMVAAMALIAFGSIGNVLRTIKFALEKVIKG